MATVCVSASHLVLLYAELECESLLCEKCGFKNVMMAMPSTIDKTGVHFTQPTGTEEELASLAKSYEHLCKMRDEIVELGIVPPVAEWTKMNPNL